MHRPYRPFTSAKLDQHGWPYTILFQGQCLVLLAAVSNQNRSGQQSCCGQERNRKEEIRISETDNQVRIKNTPVIVIVEHNPALDSQDACSTIRTACNTPGSKKKGDCVVLQRNTSTNWLKMHTQKRLSDCARCATAA